MGMKCEAVEHARLIAPDAPVDFNPDLDPQPTEPEPRPFTPWDDD